MPRASGSSPESARKGRTEGFFFVNGRIVKSRALEHAVAPLDGPPRRVQRILERLLADARWSDKAPGREDYRW